MPVLTGFPVVGRVIEIAPTGPSLLGAATLAARPSSRNLAAQPSHLGMVGGRHVKWTDGTVR